MATLGQAVSNFITGMFNFHGRATRAEFWWIALLSVIVNIVINSIGIASGLGFITWVLSMLIFIATLALTVRRLHDTNKSGLRLLWLILPLIGQILVLIWTLQGSDNNTNNYGPPQNF